MFHAIEIANFYIHLANSIPEDSIDNLKINKLLYFVQGCALSALGHPIFSDEILAWDYGPVVKEVYDAFKCCGKNYIAEPTIPFDESRLSCDELQLLLDVYQNYGQYSGIALKNLTHLPGTPWHSVYEKGRNHVIPQEVIRDYFDSDRGYKPFALDIDPEKIVSAVPSAWDSSEDQIYDRM